MSTNIPSSPSDAQLLYQYLGQRIEQGPADLPAAEVVADLSAYGDQLRRLRELVDDAELSLANDLAKPLDVEALLERVRQRAANRDEAQ